MFVDIYEYMSKSKQERQVHLALTEPCILIGGFSKEYRALLAHYLGTTLPSGKSIHLAHACHNDGCSNPKHLYWATMSENMKDAYANGRINPMKGKPAWNSGKKIK
jgi:hypothetical protein